jgi:hypothetical protein
MLKMKSAVTAAILFVAAGAFASNFRAADQVYVPAAGHVVGGSQLFISDVFISNLTSDPVSVSVLFSSGPNGGAPQSFNNVVNLAANERQEINDFVGTKLGLTNNLGQLIFNGCKTGGDCSTTCPGADAQGNCPDFRNISVESRIYSVPASSANPATAPTTGQLFSGIPWYNFVSSAPGPASVGLDKVFITGLRNNGQYRTNIGLVNASQFSTTTLVVKLFDGRTNTQIGSTFQQTLGPLGQAQPGIGALFSHLTGPSATNAFVTVEQPNTQNTAAADAFGCTDGCPAFFAYGSQLDNVTGDATTLESQYLRSLYDIGSNHGAIACIYDSSCKTGVTLKIRRAAKH